MEMMTQPAMAGNPAGFAGDITAMMQTFFAPRGIATPPRRESPAQVVARLNATMDARNLAGDELLDWCESTMTETGYDADECVSFFETNGVRVALPAYPCRFHLESDWLGHMAERRAS